jgi:hypothetical protein
MQSIIRGTGVITEFEAQSRCYEGVSVGMDEDESAELNGLEQLEGRLNEAKHDITHNSRQRHSGSMLQRDVAEHCLVQYGTVLHCTFKRLASRSTLSGSTSILSPSTKPPV